MLSLLKEPLKFVCACSYTVFKFPLFFILKCDVQYFLWISDHTLQCNLVKNYTTSMPYPHRSICRLSKWQNDQNLLSFTLQIQMKYETSALIWIFDLLHKSTSKKNLLKRERESILDLGAIGQYCSYSTRMSSVILESLLESWFIITHVLH